MIQPAWTKNVKYIFFVKILYNAENPSCFHAIVTNFHKKTHILIQSCFIVITALHMACTPNERCVIPFRTLISYKLGIAESFRDGIWGIISEQACIFIGDMRKIFFDFVFPGKNNIFSPVFFYISLLFYGLGHTYSFACPFK